MKTKRMFTTLVLTAVLTVILFTGTVQAKTVYQIATQQTFDYQEGKWVLRRTVKNTYDKKGRIKTQTDVYRNSLFDENTGDITYKDVKDVETFSYNSAGRITKLVSKSDGKETYRFEATFNKYGDTATTKNYQDGKLVFRRTFKYSKKHVLSSVTEYDAKNKKTVSTYKNDAKGNPVKITTKDQKGKVVRTTTFTYKYKGKIAVKETMKESGKDSDGKDYTTTTITERYTNGVEKKITYKYKSDYSSTSVFEYDKQGRSTRDYLKNKYMEETTTYKAGYPQKIISKNSDGSKTETTYSYKRSKKGVTEQLVKLNGDIMEKTTYTYVATK